MRLTGYFLLSFLLLSSLAFANTPISDCANLSSANTVYDLTANTAIASSTCMNITAQNITLDCHGYNITGDNTAGASAIYAHQTGINLQNCPIINFPIGVTVNGYSGSAIANISCTNTSKCFSFTGTASDTTNITNTTLTNVSIGFYSLTASVVGVSISGISGTSVTSLANGTTFGFAYDCRNGTVVGLNTAGAFGSGASRTVSNCNFKNFAGIMLLGTSEVSTYTNITYNDTTTTVGISASGGNTGGTLHLNNITMWNGGNTVVVLGTYGSNSLIENSHFYLTGTGLTEASTAPNGKTNITWQNNYFSTLGYFILPTSNSETNWTIYNNTIANCTTPSTSNGIGCFMFGTSATSQFSNFMVTDNTVTCGNTAARGNFAILGANSTNNTFLRNNITCRIWFNGTGVGNILNTSTQGNIYYFINGTPSWASNLSLYDTNGDTWADAGSSIPFNATTVANVWTGVNQDFHPYTTNTTNGTIHNALITINQIFVNSTTNDTTAPVQGWLNASTNDTGTLTANCSFFLNGVNQTATAFLKTISNNTLINVANVSAGMSAGNWSLNCFVGDGTNTSTTNMSANLSITAGSGCPTPTLNTNLLITQNCACTGNYEMGTGKIIISAGYSFTLNACFLNASQAYRSGAGFAYIFLNASAGHSMLFLRG